jgi:hypothetical protein
MTTIALSPSRGKPSAAPTLFLLVVLLLAASALSIHALQAHQVHALQVQKCMDDNGPIQVWQRANGYRANICEIEPGKFGIEIVDEHGEHVTSFVKDKMHCLEQVTKYLINRGYWRIVP